ncbi:MAG: hypothetical protein A2X40_02475 [Elusimicrobia bacterium GWC2_65_9]|nr:MAG: hypothetical protein A2X37_08675 [Elusimicrobia bacterium GWA2_66_18]OGR72969.1 MAG: hypothetical protein A2X40_02475 [Elusimicrobia bacterium GWC2_65_9]
MKLFWSAAVPLSLLLGVAALPLAAQQRVDATAVTGAAAGSGGSAAAAINAGADKSVAPSLSVTPGVNVLGTAGVLPPALHAPAAATGADVFAAHAVPAVKASPGKTLIAEPSAPPIAIVPDAGSDLTLAAHGVSEARVAETPAGGDGMAVHRALARVFDSSADSTQVKGGVAGRVQGVREAVAQKVVIANTSSPADAPDLYRDAIKTAKDALPAGLADAVAKVVRGFASRKAEVSLADLALAAYEAASGGSAKETNRILAGFDKWESLLGVPGRPLVANQDALKDDVKSFLDAKFPAGRSIPHVWFERTGVSLTARIPGAVSVAAVVKVPSLAAGFAIAPAAFGPEAALADSYRAFAEDPRASTGAGLVYRARRALGSSVPSAALSSSRFWLRAALESFWRRLVSLAVGATAYRLAERSGGEAVRRDAALVREIESESSVAAQLLSVPILRVAGARAALAALLRCARAFESLTGEKDARLVIEALGGTFERTARAQSLTATDELPAGLASLVKSPGGLTHWAGLLRGEAARSVDAKLWRGREGAGFLNLGAQRSPAVSAAFLAKEFAGSPLTLVAFDDRFWARGRGPYGEVRLSSCLQSTDAGGGIRLLIERGDAFLARRLEALGLSVFLTRAGMTAVLGPEDISLDASEVGLLSAQAVAAAFGADVSLSAAATALREILDEIRRDPAAAAALAARFDGHAVFAAAPVIGLVGEYEAVGPVSTILDGQRSQIAALRDPDTGLLVYARVLRETALGR